jgi:histidinol phosphatase-like enzyme
MTIRIILSWTLLAFGSLSLTSCFSSSKVDSKNQASVGKQLTDLDAAYKQGIITEKDYLKLKKAIIKNND